MTIKTSPKGEKIRILERVLLEVLFFPTCGQLYLISVEVHLENSYDGEEFIELYFWPRALLKREKFELIYY